MSTNHSSASSQPSAVHFYGLAEEQNEQNQQVNDNASNSNHNSVDPAPRSDSLSSVHTEGAAPIASSAPVVMTKKMDRTNSLHNVQPVKVKSFLTLRSTFLILSVIQVVVACILVWYIGLLGTTRTVNQLAADYRNHVMNSITTQIDQYLSVPSSVVTEAEYMLQKTFGGLFTGAVRFASVNYSAPQCNTADIKTNLINCAGPISNTTGFLSDISLLLEQNPSIAAIYFAGLSGHFIAGQNIRADGTSIDGVRYYGFSEGYRSNYSYYLFNHTRTGPSYPNRIRSAPDIKPTEALPQVLATLNLQSRRTFIPQNSAWWMTNITEGDLRWSVVYPYFTTGVRGAGIAMVKPIYITPPTGSPLFIGLAVAALYLTAVEKVLMQLPFVDNGAACIIASDGTIVACTLKDELAVSYVGRPIYQQKQNSILSAIANELSGLGFIQPSHYNSGASFSPSLQLYSSAQDASASIDGSSYNMRAQLLPTPGLTWTLVLLTKNSDFTGGLAQNNITTAIFSVVVLVCSLLLALVISYFISRPMIAIAQFMSLVGAAESNNFSENNASTHHFYTKLHQKFKQSLIGTGIVLEDSEASKRSSKNSSDQHSTNSRTPYLPPSHGEEQVKDCQSYARACWHWTNSFLSRLLFIGEVEQIYVTFGKLLKRVQASHEAEEKTAEQKKQFLRYLFHEIRYCAQLYSYFLLLFLLSFAAFTNYVL
jgi:hypothetical protein